MSEKWEACSHCDGSGMILLKFGGDDDPGMWCACAMCKGEGGKHVEVVDSACQHCYCRETAPPRCCKCLAYQPMDDYEAESPAPKFRLPRIGSLDDCRRIQGAIADHGAFATLPQCFQMWRKHSDGLSASWLGLPEADAEIVEVLDRFFEIDDVDGGRV